MSRFVFGLSLLVIPVEIVRSALGEGGVWLPSFGFVLTMATARLSPRPRYQAVALFTGAIEGLIVPFGYVWIAADLLLLGALARLSVRLLPHHGGGVRAASAAVLATLFPVVFVSFGSVGAWLGLPREAPMPEGAVLALLAQAALNTILLLMMERWLRASPTARHRLLSRA